MKFRRKRTMLKHRWININKIKITPQFQENPPKLIKMAQKYDWYKKYGKFQSPIVLNKDYTLMDGYTSYLIAQKVGKKSLFVYFLEKE